MTRRSLTAAELAVFLGVNAASVRQIARRHRINPVGKWGRANLYDPAEVLRHAGPHDRRADGEHAPAV